MMRPLARRALYLTLPLLVLSTMGCSQLEVTVRRYDTAFDDETIKAYAEAHPREPTIRTRRSELNALKQQVRQYEQWVISLNTLATQLNDGTGSKTELIPSIFAKFYGDIDREIGRLEAAVSKSPVGDMALAPRWNADFEHSWATLQEELEKAHVETDPAIIERAAGEDVERNNSRLVRQAQSVLSTLRELADKAGDDAPPATAEFKAVLSGLDKARPAAAEVRSAIVAFDKGYRQLRKSTAEAVKAPARQSADLVQRSVEVYQDPTDPFLAYLARHPDGWFELGNHSRVKGDGDTEFVLVFESPLDSRFKLISVDPSKVIMARLSIARKAAQAAIAVGGLAMGSFGVPVPNGIGGTKESSDRSIDYSRLTGEEAQMRDSNARNRARIEKLRNWASAQARQTDADEAQRTLDALVRELQALGPSSSEVSSTER